MVSAHDLQGSAVLGRVQAQRASRAAHLQLIADPETFLGAHALYGNAGNGHQTVIQQTPFELLASGDVRMGINALGPGACQVGALLTPTRANAGPAFVNRLAAVQRFMPGQGGANTWLTDQQTGCSVLIMDWGGNFSMAHILPYTKASYGRTMRGGMWAFGHGGEASIQNKYLRTDMNAVVQASIGPGGQAPQRYILLQSQESLNARQLLQLVGIAAPAGWNFYVQRIQVTPAGRAVHSVTRLQWRTWGSDWVWHSATS